MEKANPMYDPDDIFRLRALRQPTTDELLLIEQIKTAADHFMGVLNVIPESRELSIAKTNVEQSVMWAVKGVTK